MIAVINKERRLKVIYKTVNDSLVIVSPADASIDSKTLEIALRVLDGKINIDSLLEDGVDVVDDGISYIEAPKKFWQAVNDAKVVIKATEDTYYHKHGVSVYDKNTIIVRRKNETE
ncbi:hypothetical protein [Nostoc phage YongM]|nr:hypothetical protein [Nostoc phage YongM]